MYDDRKEVGWGEFQYEDTHRGRGMYIVEIKIYPNLKRKGYGSLLTKYLEETARKEGVGFLWLIPLKTSKGFWEKMGYRLGFGDKPGDDYGMFKNMR